MKLERKKVKKIVSKVCLYCGDPIILEKKFGTGFGAWLAKRIAKHIKSCHNCDKFFRDVTKHNAAVGAKLYKKNRQNFYDEYKGQDDVPYLMPQFDNSMAQQILEKESNGSKKKKGNKEHLSYVG